MELAEAFAEGDTEKMKKKIYAEAADAVDLITKLVFKRELQIS